MKYVDADKGLKVFDIKFDVQTAGPSPNENKRIELFLLGCDKAMRGDACKGCFNRRLWDSTMAEFSCDIEALAEWIIDRTPENERYITIGGAEPTFQIDHLIPFCKILKRAGFHIMIYTYRELLHEFNISNKSLMNVFLNFVYHSFCSIYSIALSIFSCNLTFSLTSSSRKGMEPTRMLSSSPLIPSPSFLSICSFAR